MPIVPTVTLGPFLGENNRLPRHALQVKDKGAFLAASQNVDIDNTGRLSRANGSTLVQALSPGHSLYSNGVITLYAEGTSFRRITSFSPFTSVELATLLNTPLAYAEFGDEVFVSDGTSLIAVSSAGVVRTVPRVVQTYTDNDPLRKNLSEYKDSMVGGHLLAFLSGRLFAARDTLLVYSDLFDYGAYTPGRNYIQFPENITVIAPCVNGLYVVADKTYWLTAVDTPEMAMREVLPYGAVTRSAGALPHENKVFWLSTSGLVIANDQGQAENVQEKNLLLELSGAGASLFVEGNDRIIATNG